MTDVTRSFRRGMIALRGDLSSEAFRAACTAATGTGFPDPLRAEVAGESGLAWMSPDEVLVLVPHARVQAVLDDLRNALQGTHFLAENLSDARAHFVVTGPDAREVMAKLAPVDLHPDAFRPGDFRRTRLAQVAAAFWMREDEGFEVICFASVADYVQDLLEVSAAMGSVGHF